MPILIGPGPTRGAGAGNPTLATTPPATAVVRKSRRLMIGPPCLACRKRGDYRLGRVGEYARPSLPTGRPSPRLSSVAAPWEARRGSRHEEIQLRDRLVVCCARARRRSRRTTAGRTSRATGHRLRVGRAASGRCHSGETCLNYFALARAGSSSRITRRLSNLHHDELASIATGTYPGTPGSGNVVYAPNAKGKTPRESPSTSPPAFIQDFGGGGKRSGCVPGQARSCRRCFRRHRREGSRRLPSGKFGAAFIQDYHAEASSSTRTAIR
jgi:hypothetical protein